MKEISRYKTIRQFANAFARSKGYGMATSIIVGEETKIYHTVNYGYRKKTTGQYVCNAYRNNFGWKNTYYQNQITIVQIGRDVARNFGLI